LISGTPGYRFITPNARVLIHKMSGGSFGNVSDMEDDVKAALQLQKNICKLIVEYTKISKNKLEKMMERQTYLSAKEAKEMGLVDEIADHNSVIYKKVRV
jgi:ATP-dependent Clp protease protease subunit